MTHPLYVAVQKSIGMRQLAGAAVHAELKEHFNDVTTRVWRNVITVAVLVPRWYWIGFGLLHWSAKRQARWIAKRTLQEVRVPMLVKVTASSRSEKKSRRPIGGSSDGSS